MRLNQRQQQILAHLQHGDYVEVKELASQLDVDSSTIRRDLQTLSNSGVVERLHGGVRLPAGASHSPEPYLTSTATASIAAAARRLLKGGEHVMLGGGAITERLVGYLLDLPELTVTTTSLRVAELLSRHPHIGVRVAGGELKGGFSEVSGDDAVAYFERQTSDWCFLEVDAVHPFAGLTSSKPWQVSAHRAMLAAARRRCVLSPSSAIGSRTIGFIADIESIDLLITDENLPDAELPVFGGRIVRSKVDDEPEWRRPGELLFPNRDNRRVRATSTSPADPG